MDFLVLSYLKILPVGTGISTESRHSSFGGTKPSSFSFANIIYCAYDFRQPKWLVLKPKDDKNG